MGIGDRVLTGLLGLPPVRGGYRVEPVRVPTRDGLELAGDLYVPDGASRGTVLVRSPYGRGSFVSLLYAKPFAARGYHVLVQSVRGTFGSGGPFEPMQHEIADGQDTVEWLRGQPWFGGRFATAGPSYLGFTQWALLTDPPPELATAVILVGPHDFWQSAHGTGAFTLNDFVGWSDMVSHQESLSRLGMLVRTATAERRVAPAMARLPIVDAGAELFDGGAAWYPDWVGRGDPDDPFWTRLRLGAALDRVSVPLLLVGGWMDLFLRQTVEQYEHLRERGADVAMLIGPWQHADVVGRAAPTIARSTLRWLDRHLASTGPRPASYATRIFVTGAREWRDVPAYPVASSPRQLWTAGDRLVGAAPPEGGPAATFTYDPADPTPTVGGRILSDKGGSRDNGPLEARADVLCFTGDALAAPLEVIGRPVVRLRHGSDNPHADLFVRLCEVDARGVSRNVSDGFVRLPEASAEPSPVVLELDPMAHRFAAGSRLRLLVAGGSHPHWARNLGTDEAAATGTKLRPATHTVEAGSTLTLPIPH
jgi:uncharacterized protein